MVSEVDRQYALGLKDTENGEYGNDWVAKY